jgi:hypothetical protein
MLETEIKKLTAAIEALTARLGTVDAPTVDAPTADAPTADAPTADARSITINQEELTRVCLALSRAGKKDDIKAKLSELSAARVGELKGDNLATFAAWAVAQ